MKLVKLPTVTLFISSCTIPSNNQYGKWGGFLTPAMQGEFFSHHINICIVLSSRNLNIYRKKPRKNLNHLDTVTSSMTSFRSRPHQQARHCCFPRQRNSRSSQSVRLHRAGARSSCWAVLSIPTIQCMAAHLGQHQSFQLLLQGPQEVWRQ